MNPIFLELTGILVAAGIIAYVLHFLKQPSIIAYILTGLLIGPFAFYHVQHGEILHGLSDVGITLLLFMVGLDLDISQLKRIGKSAIIAGIGQVVFTATIGFIITLFLGMEILPAIYIAVALTFSSTIIVVKLLSEKRDMQSLYGKLAVGIFLVQDITAIIILILLSGANGQSDTSILFTSNSIPTSIIFSLGKAFMIGVVVIALSRTVFPKLLHSLMRSDELVLLFSLAWSLGLAALFASPILGFNAAIGGFVAGLALANTGAHYQISGKVKPLRDFFIIIFFIVLGSQLIVSNIANAIIPATVLTLFVLIGNPLIVTVILGFMGYKIRTSFLTGVTVAQISEFSLILMTLGLASGYVTELHVTIVTLVGIATIGISSYGILYSNRLYEWMLGGTVRILEKKFKRRNLDNEDLGEVVYKNHLVLVGAHRLASHLINDLKHHHKDLQYIIIDFDPDVISHFKSLGLAGVCGDIADPYIQEVASLDSAKLVIATIPDFHDTLAMLEAVAKFRRKPKLIVAAGDEVEAIELYKKGADYVLLPHFVGGMHLTDIVEKFTEGKVLKKLKERHLKTLEKNIEKRPKS